MRINRYLALCGVASRRKSEEIIKAGLVKVNGETVRELAFDIKETRDRVTVSGRAVTPAESGMVYYMLNKPAGVISAVSADHGETTVVDLLPNETARIFPVGRLDKDTEGLILLTNDGDFSYRLTHPKFEKQKTYIALLQGLVDRNDLKRLYKGVVLDGRTASAYSVRTLKTDKNGSLIEIIITEGRNRQIRRMCEVIGHPVISLKRTSEAGLNLGSLKSGESRALTPAEVQACLEFTFAKQQSQAAVKTKSVKKDLSKD